MFLLGAPCVALAAFQAGWHGGTVTIWTSRSGRQTGPPLTPSQIVDQAAITAMLAVTGQTLLLIVSAPIIRRILDRRKMAAWDAERSATGPHWSRWR